MSTQESYTDSRTWIRDPAMNCLVRWRDSSDFRVVTDISGNYFTSDNLTLKLKLKPDGYVPKSGLHLLEVLDYSIVYGSVLDIGTGETGIIAHYLLTAGADKVVACDIDCNTVIHASKSSHISNEIHWITGNVFGGIGKTKFDLIVSNPPQMPCVEDSVHDCGGTDGRSIINRIIQEAPDYLVWNGKLLLLCFDFLGVNQRFSQDPSLFELAEQGGFKHRIVQTFTRSIRRGGKTENSLSWINQVYPDYQFQKTPDGRLSHDIYILELTKS